MQSTLAFFDWHVLFMRCALHTHLKWNWDSGSYWPSCPVLWKVFVPILQTVLDENIGSLLCQAIAGTNTAKAGMHLHGGGTLE